MIAEMKIPLKILNQLLCVSLQALELFSPRELELLVCGNPVLDFEALERVTQYVFPKSR